MIVVSSINGKIGLPAALEVLERGGSALDAVEAGTHLVERNAQDQSVGLGGLPNLAGEVCLDAAIMDGRTLRAGAVGSVRGCLHVITLARRVMEVTPHVFLVGAGAERLARELGMAEEELLTPAARTRWRRGLQHHYPGLEVDRLDSRGEILDMVRKLNQPMAGWTPEAPHGTVNFIARDGRGNLATAVSTSGWPWSYPGRLGDSPVIGAGSYADNRWGAAASTGTGEVVLRTSATRSIILYLKMGMDLAPAVKEALRDLRDLRDPHADHIAIIAMDRRGAHVGYAHRPGARYAWMGSGMEEPGEGPMASPGMGEEESRAEGGMQQ